VDKNKIAASVILYCPTKEHLYNIKNYVNEVGHVFIYDNTPKEKIQYDHKYIINIFSGIMRKHVTYTGTGENIGIGEALNITSRLAIKKKFKFIITLDQDTVIESGIIERICREFDKINFKNVGIIAPSMEWAGNKKRRNKFNSKLQISKTLLVITSGSIVNLQAFKKVGGYNSDLFIDEVDHDYCLKNISNGFNVLKINNLFIPHELGNSKVYNVFNTKIVVTHHNYKRRYYIIRNRLYMIKRFYRQYPSLMKIYIKETSIDMLKMIVFETDKIRKIVSVIMAAFDFIIGKKGKKYND